jgi:hypothetical protein
MTENVPGLMAGKTALVTGGTGGIGRATAAGLATLGARVGITGRDKARIQAAATGIVRESGNPAVDAFADMSCQAGVRALAVAVRSAYPRPDVLVNNVGGSVPPGTSPPTGWSAPSPSTTSPPSCSPAWSWTGSSAARPPGSSPSRPTPRRRADSTSTTCRANAATPGSGRTASPSSPTSCSPANSPAGWKAPASPPPPCTPAWCARRSPPRTHPACRRS